MHDKETTQTHPAGFITNVPLASSIDSKNQRKTRWKYGKSNSTSLYGHYFSQFAVSMNLF